MSQAQQGDWAGDYAADAAEDDEFAAAEEAQRAGSGAGAVAPPGAAGVAAAAAAPQRQIETSFGVSSLLPNMNTIRSSLRTGMASITHGGGGGRGEGGVGGGAGGGAGGVGASVGAAGSTSAHLTMYHSYFSAVSAAPLQSEDGDPASFELAPLEHVAEVNAEEDNRS